jgi:tRNA 5-methylaminomethyl-2-thiouridine biosynthesis bifunctional protein
VQHSEGGWLRPNQWLLALQTACQKYPGFTLRLNSPVDALRLAAQTQDHTSVPLHGGPHLLASGNWQGFDAAVLCNAMSVLQLLPGLTLRPVTGQVALLQHSELTPLTQAYCGQANIIPMQSDLWCVGNSYERGVMTEVPRDHIRDQLLRGAAEMLSDEHIATLGVFCQGWAGTRVESLARLPLIGELKPGLWLDTAHASKGFMTAFLAAEIIGARLLSRTVALPARLVRAVDLAERALVL